MNTVRPHREALGKSREALAVEARVSYSFVSQLEARAGRADEPTPGIDIARRLASALGCDVDALFPPADPTPADAAPAHAESK